MEHKLLTLNDCWSLVRECNSYEEIQEVLAEMPAWSGDWTCEEHCDDGYVLVINDIFNDATDEWESSEEEIDVMYYGKGW